MTVNSLDIAIFPAQDIQLYLPKEDFPLEMDETTTSIRTYYYLDFDKGNVDSKRMNKVIFEENGIAVMMASSFEVKVLLQIADSLWK